MVRMHYARFITGATVLIVTVVAVIFVAMANVHIAAALTPLPTPDPQPGSYGVEATKKQAPPTRGATITVPGNGASFSASPITVSGICPTDLLVQIYNNNVMVGSVMCKGGSFRLEISLFPGKNELYALVFDDLDQAGPKSNVITVNYTDTRFTAFGQMLTLTSSYGRRSAATGTPLAWPLQLSGGTGPYAFQIDWGDGSEAQLVSQSLAGVLSPRHTYKKAGIYQVNIRVTDANGVSAFLQVIAVSSGVVEATTEDEEPVSVAPKSQILWVPTAVATILLIPTYWLGRRSQLVSLRTKMLKERDAYQDKGTKETKK